MTLHSDDKTEEAASRKALNGYGTAAPTAQLLLDAVCRSAAELARATPKPPQRIRLQYGQTSVEVEWPAQDPVPVAAAPVGATAVPAGRGAHPAPRPGAQGSPEQEHDTGRLRYLCAPTVGTFYHSPEPGAPPYVSVGDTVRPGQAVGVLEVMKMMSTIEADTAGRVVEVLAPDAQSVEFQQRLIAIEPLDSKPEG